MPWETSDYVRTASWLLLGTSLGIWIGYLSYSLIEIRLLVKSLKKRQKELLRQRSQCISIAASALNNEITDKNEVASKKELNTTWENMLRDIGGEG